MTFLKFHQSLFRKVMKVLMTKYATTIAVLENMIFSYTIGKNISILQNAAGNMLENSLFNQYIKALQIIYNLQNM